MGLAHTEIWEWARWPCCDQLNVWWGLEGRETDIWADRRRADWIRWTEKWTLPVHRRAGSRVNRQADRKVAYGQTGRQTNERNAHTWRQIGRCAGSPGMQTGRQKDLDRWRVDWKTDRRTWTDGVQTGRQTDRQAGSQAGRCGSRQNSADA